ncbi:hypothetical protein AB9M93_25365 [Peribacillus frigoritolerans]|uniref:hypothetical protein n=1 Tax=Peribacillus frigoritolerans TaxID=450367 RepID=UPI0035181F6E
MKLQFENWILSQEIPEEAKTLIEESIICYKSNAYRAALLFSYLCFQTIIKDRMLNAHKPDNIPEGMWEDILKKLRNDDTWDQTVFDNLQRQQPKDIFFLNDDIRNQITFWKNRRNDCAHSKNNIISASHVESFWSFLRSNLPKIMVNGSSEALLNKIKRHFDVSLTAPSTETSYIINEVPYAVEENQLNSFFSSVFEYFKENDGVLWDINENYNEFWDKLFILNNEIVSNQLVKFMKSEEELIMNFLRELPHRVNYFADDNSFIRNLWYSKIFAKGGILGDDLKLYCAILRNGLIEGEELIEAHKKIIWKYKNSIPDQEGFYILKESGFFKVFKDVALSTNLLGSFDWANRNKDIIAFYLEKFPIDEEIVRNITWTFKSSDYPWHLRKRLDSFLDENPEKKELFIKKLSELSIDPPSYLNSISGTASE